MTRSPSSCAHHWKLDAAEGQAYPARCKKCDATTTFPRHPHEEFKHGEAWDGPRERRQARVMVNEVVW